MPVEGYIAPHFHDYDETLTFLSGRAELVIDGQSTIVEADTTALLTAGSIHSLKNIGDEPIRILAWYLASVSRVKYAGDKPPLVDWGRDGSSQ